MQPNKRRKTAGMITRALENAYNAIPPIRLGLSDSWDEEEAKKSQKKEPKKEREWSDPERFARYTKVLAQSINFERTPTVAYIAQKFSVGLDTANKLHNRYHFKVAVVTAALIVKVFKPTREKWNYFRTWSEQSFFKDFFKDLYFEALSLYCEKTIAVQNNAVVNPSDPTLAEKFAVFANVRLIKWHADNNEILDIVGFGDEIASQSMQGVINATTSLTLDLRFKDQVFSLTVFERVEALKIVLQPLFEESDETGVSTEVYSDDLNKRILDHYGDKLAVSTSAATNNGVLTALRGMLTAASKPVINTNENRLTSAESSEFVYMIGNVAVQCKLSFSQLVADLTDSVAAQLTIGNAVKLAAHAIFLGLGIAATFYSISAIAAALAYVGIDLMVYVSPQTATALAYIAPASVKDYGWKMTGVLAGHAGSAILAYAGQQLETPGKAPPPNSLPMLGKYVIDATKNTADTAKGMLDSAGAAGVGIALLLVAATAASVVGTIPKFGITTKKRKPPKKVKTK